MTENNVRPRIYFILLILLCAFACPAMAQTADAHNIIKLNFRNLDYNKDTRKKYPFLETDLDSRAYLQYDPYGEKIDLYDMSFKSRYLNKEFVFIYNASGEAYCGKLGCSLDGYIKSGKKFTNVISTTTFTDVYFKDCPHEQSLLLGGNDGYSEWRFNGRNFEMEKAYKKFFQVAYCTP